MKSNYDDNKLISENTVIWMPRFNDKYFHLFENNDKFFMAIERIKIAEYLFNKNRNILFGTVNNLNITNGFAGLVFLQKVVNIDYLQDNVKKLSSNNGLLLYNFNELIDVTDESTILYHIKQLRSIGLKVLAKIDINNQAFILARKVSTMLLKKMIPSDYKDIFLKKCISIIELEKSSVLDFRMTRGKLPHMFYEKELPPYKLEKLNSYKTNLPTIRNTKINTSYIKMPNIEQAAILLASGKFENELILNDGRKMVFKGTDTIDEEKKYVYNIYSEIDAVRYIKKRNTVVIGLDLTNNEFIRFE